MANIKSKKVLQLFISLVVITLTIIIAFTCSANTASAAERQTDVLINEIQYRIEESLKTDDKYLVNGMPLAMSSNPYDYIKDNDEYDKLIALGTESIDELYKLQQDTEKYDSFQRYIIAIAIEDITKTDLKQSSDYFWEDADSFSENWDEFASDAEENVLQILDDDSLTQNEKIENICFYGSLAEDALTQIDTRQMSAQEISVIDSAKEEISSASRDELVEFAQANE